jgi:hypothetical protein
MPFFSRKNKYENKPPHTWYPDILHWREGDTILCSNIAKAIGYSKATVKDLALYDGPKSATGYATERFKYKSVDAKGMIYLENEKGHLHSFEFWRFIKASDNISLKSREVEAQQADSESYMELIQNFQKAFNELQEKDAHPKRLGDSSSS